MLRGRGLHSAVGLFGSDSEDEGDTRSPPSEAEEEHISLPPATHTFHHQRPDIRSLWNINVNVMDFLDGSVKLTPSGRCDRFEAEPDEGNMEYKLKLVDVSAERLDHLVTQLNYRLKEGNGEAIYRVGVEDDGDPRGVPEEELRTTVRTIAQMADRLGCHVSIRRYTHGREGLICTLLVRKTLAEYVDIRVCIIGNVDSGKSTLVGVLTTGKLDNGRGRARMTVLRHRHEIEHGRTSSISRAILGFDKEGGVTNYDSFKGVSAWEDIVEDSTKVLTLMDLAGHERYLRTTVFGVSAHTPDYALLAVAGNSGVLRMTRQHLGVCIALRIPTFIVITKIDQCSKERLEQTIEELRQILCSPDLQKLLVMVRTKDEIVQYASTLREKLAVPVFLCSCVTGQGLDDLKDFLSRLPKIHDYSKDACAPALFAIDDAFSVGNVGTVVSGILQKGTVEVNDTLLLGPDPSGGFRPVNILSIHVQRNPAKLVVAGQSVTFALDGVARSELRKGMVLAHPSRQPRAVRRFDARVLILHHDKSIKPGHEIVIHAGTVHQAARVMSIESRLPSVDTWLLPPPRVPDFDDDGGDGGAEGGGEGEEKHSSSRARQVALSSSPPTDDESFRTVRANSLKGLPADRLGMPTAEGACAPHGDEEAQIVSTRPLRAEGRHRRRRRHKVRSLSMRQTHSQSTSPSKARDELAGEPPPGALPPRPVTTAIAPAGSQSGTSSSASVAGLGTGDRAIVHLQFRYRPEFLSLGAKIIFRQGRTKGVGKVTKLYF